MNYWKFRYNFDEKNELETIDLENTITNIMRAVFLEPSDIHEGIIGIHLTNSFGVNQRPHFHLHFLGEIKEGTFRDRFTKHCQKMDDFRKGQALYGLKKISEDDLKDLDKFYRYPLKEKNKYEYISDKFFEERGPETFDYPNQKLIAQAHRDSIVEGNQKYAVKEKDKEKTYDKLEKYLKEKSSNELKDIKLKTIEFYKTNKLACNFSTMKGYINTYRLIHNLMSEAEALSYLD